MFSVYKDDAQIKMYFEKDKKNKKQITLYSYFAEKRHSTMLHLL